MNRAPQPHCPVCEGPLQRRRRSQQERLAVDHRRYRCISASCAWEGLLPLPASETEAGRPAPRWVVALAGVGQRVRARGVLLASLGAMTAIAASAWLLRPDVPETIMVGPHVVHRGTHLEGDRLPATHPLVEVLPQHALEIEPAGYRAESTDVLRVRRNCAWGLPGRDPYRGSPEQALQTATLSPTVVKKISEDIRAGRRVDRVTIRNDMIRAHASGREFDPKRVALTYGMTLCVDTHINFRGNHSEGGDLYEAMDDDGKVYAVMVPDVCGNVSVLGERFQRPEEAAPPDEQGEVAGVSYREDPALTSPPVFRAGPQRVESEVKVSTSPSEPLYMRWPNVPRTLPQKLNASPEGDRKSESPTSSVSEPHSLALTSAALVLALMLGAGLRRRR